MIRECPILDHKIPVEDCDGCCEPCGNPAMYSKLEKEHLKKVEERIINIYARMFPSDCYINIDMAYDRIMRKLMRTNEP